MGLGEKLRNAMERLRGITVVDRETVKEVIRGLQRALISADVEVSLVLDLSKKIEKEAFKELPKGINRREHVIKTTYDLLVEALGGTPKIAEKPKRILLVGLYGQGKTTTTTKLARYYLKRGLKTGIICADSFRPAAFEQLKQLSEKTRIPFYGNKKEKNASKIVKEGLKKFEKYDLIIVDSAGRSGLDSGLTKEIEEVAKEFQPDQKWLVMGADTGQVAKKQANAFHKSVDINGVVLTRMDGSAKGGGALAACAVTKSPVLFIGTGEKISDLQEFNAQRYLGRIMGYGDLQALLEKAEEVEVGEIPLEELMKGQFNLEIFYKQLAAARQMGPLDKVMDMMGMKQQIPKEALEIGEEKLEGFKVIMDSMTKQEKLDPEILNKGRIARVAKGSGKSQEDVRELIKHYKNMAKVFKKFKKIDEGKLEKGGIEKLLKGFKGLGKRKKLKIR